MSRESKRRQRNNDKYERKKNVEKKIDIEEKHLRE